MNVIRRVLLLGYSHDIYEIIRRENTKLFASLMLVFLSFSPIELLYPLPTASAAISNSCWKGGN